MEMFDLIKKSQTFYKLKVDLLTRTSKLFIKPVF